MAIWRRPKLTARGDPDHDHVVAGIVAHLLELPRRAVVLAEDETHLNLLPHVRASWTLRGARPQVLTPGTNRKITVLGAIEVTTGAWVYRLGRRCAADFDVPGHRGVGQLPGRRDRPDVELTAPGEGSGWEVDDAAPLVLGDLGIGETSLGGERLAGEPGPAGQRTAERDGEPAPQLGGVRVEQDRAGVVVAVGAQRLAEPVIVAGVLLVAGQAYAVWAGSAVPARTAGQPVPARPERAGHGPGRTMVR